MYSLKRVFHYLWPHIKKYQTAFYLVFIGYGVGTLVDNIVKPYIYKDIVDAMVSGGNSTAVFHHILMLGVALAGIIIIFNIGYRIGDFATTQIQSKVMKELHDASLQRFLLHSQSFFSSNFSGGLVAKAKRFSKSFETVHDVFSFNVWFSFVQLVAVVIVLFFQARVLSYIFLVWSIVYVGITLFFIKKKMHLDVLEAEADSKVTAALADIITNVVTVKIFSSARREQKGYEKVTNYEEHRRFHAWNYANFQNIIQAALMMVLQVVVVFVMINLWHRGGLSVGTIVLVQAYMFNIFDILWILGRSLTKMVKALTDMQEVVAIFDTMPEINDPVSSEKLAMRKGNIRFNAVSFRYDKNNMLFHNLNLEIKPGERIGLVGHSGAGKSTITKLLLRFADVTDGEISIDGQDIRKVTQDDLRSVISYVPQEPILFHRTIRENIIYGKPEATEHEMIAVAKKAHAHEFISKLPNGYDTYVGERGVKLSGGERQRVAIARAMLKDAPVLILDEATSSLDSVSESYIQEAFAKLMDSKTTIVIAHRLSTIQKMDRIVVLEDGKIAEEGTHAELLKKKGIYADLWEHQSGGFLAE